MPCGAWGARRRATVPKCSGNRGLHSCPAYHRERSRIGRPHQNRTTRYDERIGNDGGKEPAPSTRPAASQRTSQRSHYPPPRINDARITPRSAAVRLGRNRSNAAVGMRANPRNRLYSPLSWNEPPPGAINVTAQIAKAAVTSPQPANVGRHICPPQTRSRTGKYHPPSSMAGSQERKNQERRHVREARSIAAPVR